MGFDFKGNNWNNKKKRKITGNFRPNHLQYTLPDLIREININNIKLYNLIENKNTELHPYIKYMDIKKLN